MPLMTVDVAREVRALRPDFAALALQVSGVRNGPGTSDSERWLEQAEAVARGTTATHPHVLAWREAYRAFGAKPQRTASSVDGLWQRAAKGQLPRVNWLVDLYNAVSVLHALPVGGEDAARFAGTLRLIRASGAEPFHTIKDGVPVIEYPDPGEVVWADTRGVTCRRWNWRQGTRTRLTDASTDVLFILERLEPFPVDQLHAAGDALVAAIQARCPDICVRRQVVGHGEENTP